MNGKGRIPITHHTGGTGSGCKGTGRDPQPGSGRVPVRRQGHGNRCRVNLETGYGRGADPRYRGYRRIECAHISAHAEGPHTEIINAVRVMFFFLSSS